MPAVAIPTSTPISTVFEQAVALYKMGKYDAALSLFRQTGSPNPKDYKLFYSIGAQQFKAGHRREAAITFSIVCKIKPTEPMLVFLARLKSTLTPDENKWVEDQVSAYGIEEVPVGPPPSDYPQWGVRLVPEVSFPGFSEFTANHQSQILFAQNAGGTDPAYLYTGTYPDLLLGGSVEPLLRLNSHFEIGLPLGYVSFGSITDRITSNLFGSTTTKFDLGVLLAGLDFRYLTGAAPLQFFLSLGPRMGQTQLNEGIVSVSSTNISYFTSTAWGAEAQFGFDWEYADGFLVSPSLGYRWMETGHLTGTVTYAGQGVLSRLEYNPQSATGSQIYYAVPDSQPDPPGMTPFDPDLSGPVLSLNISALF